jgi:arabinogalactan endo-1,4-beta-galactosidase
MKAKLSFSDLITRTMAVSNRKCLGVFYLEPEAYGWKCRGKGAIDLGGRSAWELDAFRK